MGFTFEKLFVPRIIFHKKLVMEISECVIDLKYEEKNYRFNVIIYISYL